MTTDSRFSLSEVDSVVLKPIANRFWVSASLCIFRKKWKLKRVWTIAKPSYSEQCPNQPPGTSCHTTRFFANPDQILKTPITIQEYTVVHFELPYVIYINIYIVSKLNSVSEAVDAIQFSCILKQPWKPVGTTIKCSETQKKSDCTELTD